MQKVERLIQRPDGSEVKIVAQGMYGAGLHLSIDTYVLVRASAQQNWRLASDRPHPDWRNMSVDEYVKHGRPEKLCVATTAEILSVAQEVRQQAERLEAEAATADGERHPPPRPAAP